MQAASCKRSFGGVLGALTESDGRLALSVFAVALLVRLLNYDLLSADFFLKYPSQAALYALGRAEATRAFTASPLYLFYWIGVDKLLGGSVAAGGLLQILIGSANCALIAVLGKRLFNPTAGLIAGLAAALYLPFIVHDGSFVSATVVVFLNLCALLLLERAREGSRAGLPLGAVVLGLSACARPNALILAPFYAVWALRSRGESKLGADRARWWAAAWFTLLVLLPPALVTARNYRLSADFVPVMSVGGIVFYLGNNEMDVGPSYYWPRYEDLFLVRRGEVDPTIRVTHEIAERELGRPLKPSQASAFWMQQGLEFIREQPLPWLWLLVRKAACTWTGYEIHDVATSFDKEDAVRARFPLLDFAIVGSLGLVGAFWLRRRFFDLLPLYGLLLTYTITGVALTVVCRYRIPMVPALIWFAAGLVTSLPRAPRDKGWRRVLLPLACAACLFAAMSYRSYPMRALTAQYRIERDHLGPGEAALRGGHLEEAEDHLKAAIKARATYMTVCRAHSLLAAAYHIRGDLEQSTRHMAIGRGHRIDEEYDGLLLPSQQLAGDPVVAQWQAAAGYFRAGQMARAARAFAHLCKMVPNLAPAQHCYGLALARAGKTAAGLRRLRLARLKAPFDPATHWAIIRFHARPRQELVEEYQRLLLVHPDNGGFRYGLALALKSAGDDAGAERELAAACSAAPDLESAMRAFAQQVN